MSRILFLGAHPDDAEISAGGTIARACAANDLVSVATFTTSEYTNEKADLRRKAAKRASEILGHDLIWIEGGKYNQVDDISEYRLVGLVDDVVRHCRPDVVLAPWLGDSHIDHIKLARAAIASSRSWDADLYACCPAEFRTPAYQQFNPTLIVDISDFTTRKREAIEAFDFDGGFRRLEPDRLEQFCVALGSQHGFESAEGFLQLRSRKSFNIKLFGK